MQTFDMASGPIAVPGLVWAFRFGADGKAEALADDVVPQTLGVRDGWLWLHFNLTDARARDWIARCALLPPEALTVFLAKDERARIEDEEAAIFGLFSDFELELGGAGEDFAFLRFACTDRVFITGRHRPLRSLEEARHLVSRGAVLPETVDLIEQIVECFCEGAVLAVASMNLALDQVEDRVVAERIEEERRHLVPIRRSAVALHRQISSLTSVFRNWSQSQSAGTLKELAERQVARLESLNPDLAAAQERARLLQDEISARIAEETNRSLKALSTMTALLLPGSLVAGLFGMNAGPVPFAGTEGGFWFAAALCVLATLVFFWLLRRAGFRFD